MFNKSWNDFWNTGKVEDYIKFKQSENLLQIKNREVQNGNDKGTCNQRTDSWGE